MGIKRNFIGPKYKQLKIELLSNYNFEITVLIIQSYLAKLLGEKDETLCFRGSGTVWFTYPDALMADFYGHELVWFLIRCRKRKEWELMNR